MEQRHRASSLGIESRPPGFLTQRTGDAGQREILGGGLPTGTLWNDVVNVKCGFLACLSQTAVFATLPRAFPHHAAHACRNRTH